MSQSQMIRENKNQHSQKNLESQNQDVKIKDVVSKVLDILNMKYPELKFGCDEIYPIRLLEKMVVIKSNTTKNCKK